jgi:hypothetical protein
METVNCRGEQKELHEAAATYDKHCRPACSMHDTCSVLFGVKIPVKVRDKEDRR